MATSELVVFSTGLCADTCPKGGLRRVSLIVPGTSADGLRNFPLGTG
jgi:hypothetical protein